MEDTFNKLKKDGRNSVDNIITWMKDSKIVDGVKVTEDKARKLFENVADKQHVEMDKFVHAVTALAAEQKTTVEAYGQALATEGAKFLATTSAAASAAVDAASSAFKQAMDKK